MFSKMVVVGNGSVGSLTVQLGDVSNGINLIDIDGLDPVKATLTSSSFSGQAGAIFQSSQRETRDLVIKLGIEPDPVTQTVRSIKKNIYKFFRPGTKILMKFYVDDDDAPVSDGYQIYGRVESSPSPMFTQTPGVDITVTCFDPDFFDPEVVTVTGMTTADATATSFEYEGTTETGLTFTINVNRDVDEIQVYYVDGDGNTWTMDIAAIFTTGDVITVVTTPGSKSATLLRAGVTTSILYAISSQSTWIRLAPGANTLQFVATGAGIPCEVSYLNRFGEV